MTLTSWDVIVIGGGPAGAVAALVLARAGRRVLLADRARHAHGATIGEALPPAARPLLRDLDLLPRVTADGHLECHANASAWGSDDLRIHDFLFDIHGTGWHLDRARFNASLRAAAAEAGAHVLDDASINVRSNVSIDGRISTAAGRGAPSRITTHDDSDGDGDGRGDRVILFRTTVHGDHDGVRDGREDRDYRDAREDREIRSDHDDRIVCIRTAGRDELMRCRWIVDASGRAASAAIACGARRQSTDRLIAVWARFAPGGAPGDDAPAGAAGAAPRHTIDCDSRTLIESCADGWWYSALLPSRERMVAFFTDRDLPAQRAMRQASDVADVRAPDGRGFLAGIARTTHLRELLHTSGYVMRGRPRGADASSSRLDRVIGPGWIAVGDAALAFDPLSSQGIFNALYTGMQAGRAVDASLSGDDSALAAYAARIEDIHHHYLRNLAAAYASEARWSDHPFWHRRCPQPSIAAQPVPSSTASTAGPDLIWRDLPSSKKKGCGNVGARSVRVQGREAASISTARYFR